MLQFYNMSSQHEEVVFKALADGRRRLMLDLLKNGPMTTGDLCEALPELNRCTVMQHIGVLEKADLIVARREGRTRWNHLNPMPIKEIYDRWMSDYTKRAGRFISRLQTELD